MTRPRPRRIGLVGCGDVSGVHLDAIRALPGLELVGVADLDPSARERTAAARGVPGYADLAELLVGAAPDAVHVTTPHHQHVDASLQALAAGVHVLQEKPIAHTLAEGRRLVEGAADLAAQGVPRADGGEGAPRLGICFQNRYNRASQELRRLLDGGELGAVQGAWASVVWTRTLDYYRAKPWRGRWGSAGGGLLINQAIHTLDLVQWLLGPVEHTEGRVSSRLFTEHPELMEVEDTADLLLHHTSGARTTVFATLTAPRARAVELEVECELAAVELRSGDGGGLTVRWRDGRVDTFSDRAAPSGGRSYWGVSHQELIADFHASLDGPEPFWIGPEEAMASQEILAAAYRASGVGPEAATSD